MGGIHNLQFLRRRGAYLDIRHFPVLDLLILFPVGVDDLRYLFQPRPRVSPVNTRSYCALESAIAIWNPRAGALQRDDPYLVGEEQASSSPKADQTVSATKRTLRPINQPGPRDSRRTRSPHADRPRRVPTRCVSDP